MRESAASARTTCKSHANALQRAGFPQSGMVLLNAPASASSWRAQRSNGGVVGLAKASTLRDVPTNFFAQIEVVDTRPPSLCELTLCPPCEVPRYRAFATPTFGLKVEQITTLPRNVKRTTALLAATLLAATPTAARAAACQFESQGDGRVAEIVDTRSFRLDDGREVRLLGIEPAATSRQALTSMLLGREVTLRGTDDTPDRYGRQAALVFSNGSETSVQAALIADGLALVSAEIADKDCAAALLSAEAEARRAGRGTWTGTNALKNAESPDDILAGIGRFMVVEGKVLSVRQAGATTYLNFGRNWTRGFAVTISRRVLPAFENGGLVLKSLENRRIRVRGWVEGSVGPRIDVLRVGQIELLGPN